jgi:hypothetical protein
VGILSHSLISHWEAISSSSVLSSAILVVGFHSAQPFRAAVCRLRDRGFRTAKRFRFPTRSFLCSINRTNGQDVWPEATISECSWHAEKALGDHLAGHNQVPLATAHQPLWYRDENRARAWDVENVIDSGWIPEKNKILEDAFRARVLTITTEN